MYVVKISQEIKSYDGESIRFRFPNGKELPGTVGNAIYAALSLPERLAKLPLEFKVVVDKIVRQILQGVEQLELTEQEHMLVKNLVVDYHMPVIAVGFIEAVEIVPDKSTVRKPKMEVKDGTSSRKNQKTI
jgi:hypothetical protein